MKVINITIRRVVTKKEGRPGGSILRTVNLFHNSKTLDNIVY